MYFVLGLINSIASIKFKAFDIAVQFHYTGMIGITFKIYRYYRIKVCIVVLRGILY